MSEATTINPYQYDCLPNELNNGNTSGHAKVDKEKSTRSQLYTKNYRKLDKEGGEVVFTGKSIPVDYPLLNSQS